MAEITSDVPEDGCQPAVSRKGAIDLSNQPEAAHGLLLLYKKEIAQHLIRSDIIKFKFITQADLKKAHDAFDVHENQGRKTLMNILVPNDTLDIIHNNTWTIIVDIIKSLNRDNLLRGLCCVRAFDAGDHLFKFLTYAHLIDEVFIDHERYDVMKQVFPLLPSALKQTLRLDRDELPDMSHPVMIQILRQLPYCGPEWYWRLMNALYNNPIGACVVNVINPQFIHDRAKYQSTKELLAAQNILLDSERGSVVDPELDQNVNVDLDHPDDIWGLGECVSPLTLRPYQQNLSECALQGHNTIICAVTGSGKTIVATHVIKQHLTNNPQAKVAFLVPTVVLVDQQLNVLRKYLRDKYRVIGMQGGHTTIPKTTRIAKANVVVLTHQIFINVLRDPLCPKGIHMTDFSLMILDECHHTDRGHPYKEVMDRYLDIKLSSEEHAKLPQILGLTASLGVGKGASKWESVVPYIERVCAHLDVTDISGILSKDDKFDLANHVNAPKDRLVQVRGVRADRSEVPFVLRIESTMMQCEKVIETTIASLDQQQDGNPLPLMPDVSLHRIRFSITYETWVNTLYRAVTLSHVKDSHARLVIRTAIEFLKICVSGLFLYAHIPLNQVVLFIKEEMKLHRKVGAGDVENTLRQHLQESVHKIDECVKIATAESLANPLIDELVRQLARMDAKHKNTKAIVFVKTRELAHEVAMTLKQHPCVKQLNAKKFTSCNVSSDRFGLSLEEGKETVAQFRNGSVRVLVATSVLQEGVDVPTCNLIIKYNHVTSLIAAIQSRGRGRADDSESVLLAAEGWIAEQEVNNLLHEQMMNQAITHIVIRGPEQLKKKNKAIQQQEFVNRINGRQIKHKQEEVLEGRKYFLVCPRCTCVLSDSDKVRLLHKSHYVLCDPNAWNRIIIDTTPTPKSYYMVCLVGNILCNGETGQGCGEIVGKVVTFQGGFYPSLKAKNIILKDSQGREKATLNWQRMASEFFPVQLMTDADVGKMTHNKTVELISDGTWRRGEILLKSLRDRVLEAEESVKENDLKNIETRKQWNQHINKYLDGEEGALRERVPLSQLMGVSQNRDWDD